MANTSESAAAMVKSGRADFDTIVTHDGMIMHEGESVEGTVFLLSLPMATMRRGPFWFLGNAWSDGTWTKFGKELSDRLHALEGVDVWLNVKVPHLLTLQVTDKVQIVAPSSHSPRPLPTQLAYIIQEVIMSNQTWAQRFFEYLRRF